MPSPLDSRVLVQRRQIVIVSIGYTSSDGNHRVEARVHRGTPPHGRPPPAFAPYGSSDGRVEAAVVGMPQDDRNTMPSLR